jgi:ribosomal protein S3AE
MAKIVKGKKQWYPIIAPAMFRNRIIGEISLMDPNAFIGKIFSVNLMNITNDIKKQKMNMFFEASGFKDGKIQTKVFGFETMPSSVKRLSRRGRDKITTSFVCKTSDDIAVRLKPVVVTLSKTKGSVTRTMSKKLIAEITKKVKKVNFENLINDLITRRIQGSWYDTLKKVYPVKIFDVICAKKELSKKALKQLIEVSEEQIKEEPPKKESKEEKAEEKPKEAPKAEEQKPKTEVKEKAAVEG